MPRLRKPTNENERDKGGGSSALSTTVRPDYSQVDKLQSELSRQQELVIKRRDAIGQTQFDLHTAQQEYDRMESRVLAGRADASLLEHARKQLAEAKQTHAKASVECEETERLLNDVLPSAIQEAKNVALAQLRDRLRAETQAKAKQLAALLAQAKGISDELRQLSNAADTYFTVNEMVRLQVSLIGVMDLGEDYGYVSPRAGIPNLAWGWLTGRSLQQPTLFDVWRRELEAYLEHSPAEMAEADKLNRVTHIAQDARRYKEALVREEAQRKLEAMIEARAGGKMPKNTTMD
jgi:hypothetical protein